MEGVGGGEGGGGGEGSRGMELYLFMCMGIAGLLANTLNTDLMSRSVASDLNLH